MGMTAFAKPRMQGLTMYIFRVCTHLLACLHHAAPSVAIKAVVGSTNCRLHTAPTTMLVEQIYNIILPRPALSLNKINNARSDNTLKTLNSRLLVIILSQSWQTAKYRVTAMIIVREVACTAWC